MPLLAPVTIATRPSRRPMHPPNLEFRIWDLEFVHAFQIPNCYFLIDDSCSAKPRDLLIAQPEAFVQHLICVLAKQWRGRSHGAWRLRHPDRRPDHLNRAGHRMRAVDECPARRALRMLDHPVD